MACANHKSWSVDGTRWDPKSKSGHVRVGPPVVKIPLKKEEIRLRLGCEIADRWPYFGLLLPAGSAAITWKSQYSCKTNTTHKPRVTRSIRVTATNFSRNLKLSCSCSIPGRRRRYSGLAVNLSFLVHRHGLSSRNQRGELRITWSERWN